jgi:hypothetical protein
MALRSMSPRITGALIGFALLSACGSNPPALTSPSQPSSSFAVKQIPPPPCNLLPFSYFGLGFGASAFGLGCSSILAAPFGIVPAPLVPFNYGAIGSALPYSDAAFLAAGCGIGGLGFGGLGCGIGGYGGIGGLGYGQGLGGYGGIGYGAPGIGGIGYGQGIAQQPVAIQQGPAVQQGNVPQGSIQQQQPAISQNVGGQQQVLNQDQSLGNQQQVMSQDQSLGNQQLISQSSNL